jgi:hypothetical protein
MSPSRRIRVFAAIALTLAPVMAAAGQSGVVVSPFVSYIPSGATNPLAGFALTFGGTTGLALRSSAEMSISTPPLDSAVSQAGGYRPWGADADAMLYLGGIGGGATVFSRALSPYLFAGIGMTGGDSAGSNVVRHGWSYGAGAAIPLGFAADIFAEARWRMSEYVLPTSNGAPDSKSSMRFGLSFHVGGGGAGVPQRDVPRRGRGRYGAEGVERQDDTEYVVVPAPAPQTVIVQQEPAPEPQVVIVESEPAPVPEPVVIVERGGRRSPPMTQPVIVAPERSRPTDRVYGRRSGRPASPQVEVSGGQASGTTSGTASASTVRRIPAGIHASAGKNRVTKANPAQPSAQAQSATPAPTRARPSAPSRVQSATRVITRAPATATVTRRATASDAKQAEEEKKNRRRPRQ